LYQRNVLKQHEGCFGTGPVNLKSAQLTRTTPELAPPPLQTSAPHQLLPRPFLWTLNPMGESMDVGTTPAGERLAPTYDLTCNRPNTRRIFSGIGFRTWSHPAPKPRPYY
ncbi:hypothetical protein AVEN_122007-1, partial [Araneus ventricosus]